MLKLLVKIMHLHELKLFLDIQVCIRVKVKQNLLVFFCSVMLFVDVHRYVWTAHDDYSSCLIAIHI